eukprot:5290460-Amphidinium_carterae.1
MEARELESGRREQVLQGQVQNLTTQLTVSQQAGGATPGGGTSASRVGAVDTRSLGKPEVFEGVEAKWHDFRVGYAYPEVIQIAVWTPEMRVVLFSFTTSFFFVDNNPLRLLSTQVNKK